uniref:Accessory gland protein 11 n=2 Tax=Drosophila mojavensis TaxID=7230 RepID=B4KQF4_DROMO|nr:accessory gland protein 11 [Drosophila mojavensis]AJC97547.1 accessory gland protein 11 [Drosophila mojavensis]AJC97548.1 accessory gland protein 11 [Drosophila mojavensis]
MKLILFALISIAMCWSSDALSFINPDENLELYATQARVSNYLHAQYQAQRAKPLFNGHEVFDLHAPA